MPDIQCHQNETKLTWLDYLQLRSFFTAWKLIARLRFQLNWNCKQREKVLANPNNVKQRGRKLVCHLVKKALSFKYFFKIYVLVHNERQL